MGFLAAAFALAVIGAFIGVYVWTSVNHNRISSLKSFEDLVKRDVVYINVTGDDSNPGTQSKPVATLRRAIRMTRFNKNATFYFGPGTFNVGDLLERGQRAQFVSGTYVEGTTEVLLDTTITGASLSLFNSTYNVTDVMTPGEFVGKRILLVFDTFFSHGIILENSIDTITIAGRTSIPPDSKLQVYDLLTTITWDSGSTQLGGVSKTSWKFFRFEMGGDAVLNSGSAATNLIACDLFGENEYNMRNSANGGGVLESVRFVDLNTFITWRSGTTTFIRCVSAQTNASEITQFFFAEGVATIENGMFFNYSNVQVQRGLLNAQGVTVLNGFIHAQDSAIAYFDELRVESNRKSALLIDSDSNVVLEGDNNFLGSIDGSSSRGVVHVRQSSKFTSIHPLTISLSEDTGSHLHCEQASAWFQNVVTVHGRASSILLATGCKFTLNKVTLTADETNDGSSYRIEAVNTNFNLHDGEITITNVTQGIYVSGGESVTLADTTELTVQVNTGPALFIDDGTPLSVGEDATVSLETLDASDPCVWITTYSSIVLKGTSTILANDSTCILIDTKSSFVQALSASTSLRCNVTELTLASKSEGVYTTGSSATLLPGTADKTMIGADTHNTSDLIASPGETFSDGSVGAGVQDCSLYITPPP